MSAALFAFGVMCILYGIVVMFVGSGTWFFAFWFILGAAALVAAGVVVSGLWGALPGAARFAVGGAAALLVAGFAVTQVLIVQDFNDEGEPDLDYLVVLGAQVRESGPSIVLRYRLDAACRYLRENEGTMCIVSGGQGPNEHAPEAHVMAAYLEDCGIDPTRIICEDRSVNTDENIALSKAFFDPERDSIGIVTNDFHLFRALRIARKDGIVHACGIAAESSPFFLPNNMARESLGIVKDFLAGNL